MSEIKQSLEEPGIICGGKKVSANTILLTLTITLFIAILGLLFFMTHEAGVSHDEAVAYFTFTKDFKTAYTKYHKAGNHIIFSFLTRLVRPFASYHHFIRIPSVTAGVIFMTCVLCLLLRLVQTRLILPAALAMILLNRFVFVFSFMARGYALALAGIFLQIVLVLWLLKKKIHTSRAWIPILVFCLLNAFNIGSMLTTLQIMAAINISFVLASPFFYKDCVKPAKTMLWHLFSTALLSGLLTFGIYAGVLKRMRKTLTTDPFQGHPFWQYLREFFGTWVFSQNSPLNKIALILFLILAVLVMVWAIRWNLKYKTGGKSKLAFFTQTPRGWIYLLTILTFLVLFLYSVVLKLPLGYSRNQIFLIPLSMLAAVLAVDQCLAHYRAGLPKTLFLTLAIAWMAIMTWQQKPNPYSAVGLQSAPRQLLKELKSINPKRVWAITYAKKIQTIRPSIIYYAPYGYRFRIVNPQDADVCLFEYSERPENAVLFNRDWYRQFKCAVVVTGNFPKENITLNYLKEIP